MSIAVVILNWNGKELLQKFMPSVLKHSAEATIYVADNASTDDSIAFLNATYPTVTILRNSENAGYARGYNLALSKLSEEILVLLNSDVEVTPNWLAPLTQAFGDDEKLVAAQPKIRDFNNKSYFEYAGAAGGFLDSLGYPFCRGRIFDTVEEDTGQYDEDAEIFWASGACLVVRNSSFKEAGGFDEDFFSHQEEIDLCWRLKAAGGKIKFLANSVVYHVGGATLKSTNPKKTFYNFRNSLLLLFKNVKGSKVYRLILQRMILDAIAATRFLIQGKPQHFLAVLKAHFSFYSLLPKFRKKRKTHRSSVYYYKIKSIVWAYFISNKRTFNNL